MKDIWQKPEFTAVGKGTKEVNQTKANELPFSTQVGPIMGPEASFSPPMGPEASFSPPMGPEASFSPPMGPDASFSPPMGPDSH